MSYAELYDDHYERFFGAPIERSTFTSRQGAPRIQVLQFEGVMEGCRLLATLGLTHFESELSAFGEIFTVADGHWADIPFVVASCSFFVVEKKFHLGRGIAIKFEPAHPQFAREIGKTALYLTAPFGELKSAAIVESGGRSGMLWCGLFITSAEYSMFLDNGAERFESALERAAVDPFQLSRRSAC